MELERGDVIPDSLLTLLGKMGQYKSNDALLYLPQLMDKVSLIKRECNLPERHQCHHHPAKRC